MLAALNTQSKLCALAVSELLLAQIKFNIDKCYTTQQSGKASWALTSVVQL